MVVDTTLARITVAALELILAQGVKKTDLAQVAARAAVTRVTVYRYCGNKQGLVRAVCLRMAAIFRRAAEGRPTDSVRDIDLRLKRLGEELSEMPKGDLLVRLEEIQRLYPDVYAEFRALRQAAVDGIFQQALAAATRERSLRKGLNQEVLKAIFWAAVVGLIENPALVSSNISLAEICTTVTEVFRHGILKSAAEGEGHDR
jgi:AcrR family transcriptional regulator